MKKGRRKVIRIDESKCTGCGLCIPDCPEGALQIIDGKARLISELFCDGLGACVGSCPEGALTVEEREAEPYDERKVMENIVRAGANTIAVHLKHLKEHRAESYYQEAVNYLKEHGIPIPYEIGNPTCGCPDPTCGCPDTQVQSRQSESVTADEVKFSSRPSQLVTWPIQLKLVPVGAPFFAGADLLIAADCTGFASPNFHEEFLKGKVLLVCCPKLDDAEFYQQKLTEIFRLNDIRSITCLHMEVPCCYGLMTIIRQALVESGKEIPFQEITLKISGEIRR